MKKQNKNLIKEKLTVYNLKDKNPDKEFYLSLTPEERLEILEKLRQINFGYDPSTERLQRVLEVVKIKDI